MCLPDSAEYWWDVKGRNRTTKHVFTHIKGVPCGHYHVNETDCVELIDCRSCKRILDELPEIKHKLELDFNKYFYPNGKCSCGGAFKERINSSNGNNFLGCSNYPKCKNTKQITHQLPNRGKRRGW